MKAFSGFPPGKTRIVGIPRLVFAELIPLIDDLGELKLSLHVLWRLREQRGKARYLRFEDLASDEILLSSLEEIADEKSSIVVLKAALDRAVERGTLLRAEAASGNRTETLYFANTAKGRAAAEAVCRGESPGEIETQERPNIFTLYEQNIGVLSPLLAEELQEAEDTYPASWIEEAFREAVNLNKRSWRYIHAILERWHTEGKDEDRGKRAAEADRRRYLEWKHGQR